MRALLIAAVVLAVVVPAAADDRSVTLQLNDVGARGLERLLDVARRNAQTWDDADMAVSLYHAVEAARAQAAATAAAAAQKGADDKAAAEAAGKAVAEIDKLKVELKAAKDAAPLASPTEKGP